MSTKVDCYTSSSEDEEREEHKWEDWEEEEAELLCLFCNLKYSSPDSLFNHCASSHHFHFHRLTKTSSLDFYASFKLINFVRSQVAENRCWACGFSCDSKQDLQNHLHETASFKDNFPWDDDEYLKPFMQEDALLYSFDEDEGDDNDDSTTLDKEELMSDLRKIEKICIDDENTVDMLLRDSDTSKENGRSNVDSASEKATIIGADAKEQGGSSESKPRDKHLKVSFSNVVARDIKIVNENYFGAYSSFGIHREMLSDKVRTDAYRQAILYNPSLLNGAAVLDVGCGTGILSLFAAQAGASRVIAVEASDKMAAVATQIARENGLLRGEKPRDGNIQCTGVIEVVQTMVEELDKSVQLEPQSIDVLVSEWMGYCLLYESMLSSVLYARDRWLKPGGAILPDTANILVAGFGRGGTSIPFWENVYGFNMSCVGKELVEDASHIPIVDIVDSRDIVTDAAVLQTFDLLTMKPNDMDFTSSLDLQPNSDTSRTNTTLCYGVVLWFDTAFTSRFCKETPALLTTSPHTPKTHWSQTLLTFREPIAIATPPVGSTSDQSAVVGSEACPAFGIHLRISITRAAPFRSIDISLETTAIGHGGRKNGFPVQIFNLG